AEDHRTRVVGPLAAIGRVIFQAEQAGRPQRLEQLVGREGLRLLPLLDMRHDLPFEDAPHRLPKSLMFGGKEHLDPYVRVKLLNDVPNRRDGYASPQGPRGNGSSRRCLCCPCRARPRRVTSVLEFVEKITDPDTGWAPMRAQFHGQPAPG